ncbi:MAG: RAMP superfamily CRISPR-associated protein [Candidatus Desulfofervidaceae bacterium]|nr:RAMP superfamily CRISPR-associated protein [Candidatus Desulfofervidaceae bacterium]
MIYDVFGFKYHKHKPRLNEIIKEIKSNRNIKLERKLPELEIFYDEPVRFHLLFKELEGGKHNSWKNVLTEFFKKYLPKYLDTLKQNKQFFDQFCRKGFVNNFFLKFFSFSVPFTSSFFTASENKFYSIPNPIAKERPTGLPVLKGSSFKGGLRQAAVDMIENELIAKNFLFSKYKDKDEDEILEEEEKDKFYFKKRAEIVRLFGNEKGAVWFTYKSLIATGGIRDVNKLNEVLNNITSAFERYLKKQKIINSEGICRGRLIFQDVYFAQVALEVITPLDRRKRIPLKGRAPIFYEVVPPQKEVVEGTIIWFPFDLIAKGETEKIEEEWQEDKKILGKAFDKLAQKGVGAKTAEGWGRFGWEAK